MASIRIVNWKTFQHYRERRPPWIKLHRSLLDKREWIELSADASKLLVNLWIVASEYEDGVITKTASDLAWAFRIPDPQLVTKWLNELRDKDFVELLDMPDSTALAERKQSGVTETEERTETKREGERVASAPRAKKVWKIVPDDWQPKEQHERLARELGVDLARQVALFRDHEFKDNRTDADRAFNKWLRRAKEFAGNRAPMGSESSRFTAATERKHYQGHASGAQSRESYGHISEAEQVREWQLANREEARRMFEQIRDALIEKGDPAEEKLILHTLHQRIVREKLMKVVA